MKKVKWSSIFVSILYIVAGFFFFLYKKVTKDFLCSWIGYLLLIIGLIYIISYFIKPKHESFLKNEFRDGLILATLGILAVNKKDVFIEFVYFVLAIVIMISGFKKLQDLVDSWRLGIKFGLLYLVLATVSIVIGLIVMFDSTIAIRALHMLIGIGLIYSGLSDLISTIYLNNKMNEYAKSIQSEQEKQSEVEQKENSEDN